MFSYNEDKELEKIKKHIESTYGQHYVSKHIESTYGQHYVSEENKKKVQVQDILISTGHAESFYVGSAMKYLARYGKKEGKNQKDLLKAAHYITLLLNLNHSGE